MDPGVSVKVVAIKLILHNWAKLPNQMNAAPPGVATQSSHSDTEYENGIGEEVRYPCSLVLLARPWLGDFARQHRGGWMLAPRNTRACALMPGVGGIHDCQWTVVTKTPRVG